jgi:hypothetical protein
MCHRRQTMQNNPVKKDFIYKDDIVLIIIIDLKRSQNDSESNESVLKKQKVEVDETSKVSVCVSLLRFNYIFNNWY